MRYQRRLQAVQAHHKAKPIRKLGWKRVGGRVLCRYFQSPKYKFIVLSRIVTVTFQAPPTPWLCESTRGLLAIKVSRVPGVAAAEVNDPAPGLFLPGAA